MMAMQDPTAPDPWSGIDPRLAQLYQSHGVTQPGAQGSGLTDATYWNGILNQTGDWGYTSGRLGADLSGTGPDVRASGGVAPSPASAPLGPSPLALPGDNTDQILSGVQNQLGAYIRQLLGTQVQGNG